MCITLLCRFLVNVGLSITNIFLNMKMLFCSTHCPDHSSSRVLKRPAKEVPYKSMSLRSHQPSG